MRRKRFSSAAAVAGFVSTIFLGTIATADSAAASGCCSFDALSPESVYQPFLSGGGKDLIAYAPPAAAAATGDYLDAVSQNGMHRWAAERMPLKVYIEEGVGVPGYRSSMKQLLVKSFDEWCRISSGKLSWREVSSPNQADIVCNYSDTPRKAGPRGFEAGVTNTIIQQNRYTGQSSIVSATMTILTQWRGRQFNDSEIYMTELHEVGHAMGMQGHSNVPSDLMYSTVNQHQTPVLTQRDANTIAKLYRNYGTEPTVAYSPRRSSGFPQTAPRNRGYANGGFGSASYGSSGMTGSGSSDGSRVVEADGLQPFTPVEPRGGRYRGRDRWNGSPGADMGASGGSYRGFGADGFGQADPDFGGQGGAGFGGGGPGFGQGGAGFGQRESAFGQGGPGQSWRSHRRARWRNLDPAARAAIMQRRQQMQEQGFMPERGFMQERGNMPSSGYAPGLLQDQFQGQGQIPDGYADGMLGSGAMTGPGMAANGPVFDGGQPDAGSSQGVGGLLQQLFGL